MNLPSPSSTTAARGSADRADFSSTRGARGPARHTVCPALHALLQGRGLSHPRAVRSAAYSHRPRSDRDRSAFDRVIQAGGFISAPTGAPPPRTPSWWRRKTQTPRSTRRPALAAARGVARLPELAAMLFPRQAHPPQLASAGSAAARREDAEQVATMGNEGFGQLLELRRMRGGVPPMRIPIEFIGR